MTILLIVLVVVAITLVIIIAIIFANPIIVLFCIVNHCFFSIPMSMSMQKDLFCEWIVISLLLLLLLIIICCHCRLHCFAI